MRINDRLLPIKAHYFFFMAASGPILPYLTVYGKQLGIPEVVMGSITAAVPILFLLAKPAFGFVIDYFTKKRKLIFTILILCMSAFYLGLYFIPPMNIEREYHGMVGICDHIPTNETGKNFRNLTGNSECNSSWTDNDSVKRQNCNKSELASGGKGKADNCTSEVFSECRNPCLLQSTNGNSLFRSIEFYGFVTFMTLAMIFFNVSNSISDAICFDVLGAGEEKNYGFQRVWGAIGFGITALLGGIGMDAWSDEGNIKNYNPAFLMVIAFTIIDMICCKKLKLPKSVKSENILKDLSKILQSKAISIFLVFTTFVGILDGFIIYFMFWFVEDLAKDTDQTNQVKVLEGLTVAAETLGGEIIFFLISGKILKLLGYGHTLSLCFFNYALRLCLISLIPSPWWIVAVELIMQGPTYALCYTTIVAYASAISPPGTTATMQGIVAGMDDGFGYALGSLIGGVIYKVFGGRTAFQIFSSFAVVCCIAHAILYKTILKKSYRQEYLQDYQSPRHTLEAPETL